MPSNSTSRDSAGTSFQDLMSRLRKRDPTASQQVFNRYVHRLVALARKRLEPQLLQKEDPEDVVQSVFRSFFQRYEAGTLDFQDWESVWAMLALITARKCASRADYYHAERRDVDREKLAAAGASQSGSEWELTGAEPTPEEAAALNETIRDLLASFAEPKHRQIVLLALEGMPALAISEKVPCTERMVHRILERVREWLEQHGRDQES